MSVLPIMEQPLCILTVYLSCAFAVFLAMIVIANLARKLIRPVLFVVQEMSDISKQDCMHQGVYTISENLNVPKREFACIINNSDNEQKSPTYSYIS